MQSPPRRNGRPSRLGIGSTLACLAAAVIAVIWIARAPQAQVPPGQVPPSHEPELSSAGGPESAPARICGNKAILGGGPTSPPRGAIVIPAGDDTHTALAHNWTIQPGKTYWFAPGRHTLGKGQFSQIIPANNDTFVGAPGAVIDGQHVNLYAFTQRARNVTIRYLTIQNFGKPGDNEGQGVVNHDEGVGWHIDHLTVQNSAGAGVMVGSNNVLAYSCLKDNGEYGFQAGGAHITVDHNEIAGNNTGNWNARQPGCGCSGGAKFWGVNGAAVIGNYVHGNNGPGLWADTDNRGFDVEKNYFSDNQAEGFIYEISYNMRLAHNTFIRNALVAGPKLAGFPDSAVYISESGADRRVPGPYRNTLAITDNTFIDNWGGVVLWENADRFCGSPVNTSTGACTLVSPRTMTTNSCNAGNIARTPYYDDCRWKTQNVLVRGNDFVFHPKKIGPDCTVAAYCGFNGIFSQFGGPDPSWSPYQGVMVEDHITFDQNNHFKDNTYSGPWRFMVHAQGNMVGWSEWRSRPYNQDKGSI